MCTPYRVVAPSRLAAFSLDVQSPQDQSISIDMTGLMTATTDPIFLGGNATNTTNANQTVGAGPLRWLRLNERTGRLWGGVKAQ